MIEATDTDGVTVDVARVLRDVIVNGRADGQWARSEYTRGQEDGLLVALALVTGRGVADVRAELDAPPAGGVVEGMGIGAALAAWAQGERVA